MNKFQKTIIFSTLTTLTFIFFACNNAKKLPIYGQREARTGKAADGSETIDTVYQTIPAFSLLNQDSVMITQDAFKDKVYVADFFFTSCSTICPTMHRNLKTIFDAYKDNQE